MRWLVSIQTLFLATTLIPSALAQTPGAPPPAPSQVTHATDAPLNPALPTIFVVGDSTARNNADLGWGDHFAHLFDLSRVNVANRAVAGRSSRTFYNEGRWQKVVSELKPGDFVLIQMGHNDGGSNAQTVVNDAKGRSSIHSLGDATASFPIKTPYTSGPLVGETTETIHTYGWYIRKYIADARAKGATPILLTPTIRNIWKPADDSTQHIETDMGFHDLDTQLAAAEHVELVDMAAVSAARLQALGPDATARLYPIDHTHTSAVGAEANAEDVAQALRHDHSPVAAYLKP
jgi:rhamnogalacturonan acetylesterase